MKNYDVIIIGAGIGGLVCGCYLAKSNFKVLIIEQHFKPGGYCGSFGRKGFKFDVGAHYLGSLRDEGILFQILKDFDLLNRISFVTTNPTDRFVMPDRTVFLYREIGETKKGLSSDFPHEKDNIDNFFKFILNLRENFLQIVSKTKKLTFSALLDQFFTDKKLKSILSIPLISLGLPPNQASALASLVLYKEFVFDGGYYPKGGMQALPDLLLNRFKEYSGEAIFSTKVKKILTQGNKAIGVETDKEEKFDAKFIVSNADATATFNTLLDGKSVEAKQTLALKPSISNFMIYLGLKNKLNLDRQHYLTGLFTTYDINACYSDRDLLASDDLDYIFYMPCSLGDDDLAPANKCTLRLFVATNFFNKNSINEFKELLYRKMINKTSELIPDLDKNIEVREIGTPFTFNRYTLNRNGAMLGWAATPDQIDKNISPAETSIENLFLTGHWVTKGTGQSSIPLVGYCGKSTAKLIIKKNKT